MHIGSLLKPNCVASPAKASSKKRALELVSKLMAETNPDLSANDVFDSLINRERLGSTGMGGGVAIPHGRLSGLDTAVAAMVKLEQGVDFDAPDREPVDIICSLIVPEECTDEHLKLLASIAEMFSNHEARDAIRQSQSGQQLFDLITDWQTAAQTN